MTLPMHALSVIPPTCAVIRRAIAAPLRRGPMRDRRYRPRRGEVELSSGVALQIESSAARQLGVAVEEFQKFLTLCMRVRLHPNGYPIRARIGLPAGCPQGTSEAHYIETRRRGCEITAGDCEGIRRALIYLEDEMLIRRAPCLPLGGFPRWAVIEDRICHSPCATSRWQCGWELEDDRDHYPDEYLNRLAHSGINGVWVYGLLRNLVHSRALPELGPPRHRLDKLRRLTEKAGRHGIRVFLLCIEPRSIPDDHPVFARHPEIRGAKMCEITSSPCTSAPLVREYIREAMRELFRQAPALGGVINIFNGERGTNCWLDAQRSSTCPRCSRRPQWEVLAEDLNTFQTGIREASRTAKLIAWDYSMDASGLTQRRSMKPRLELLKRLDPEIIWMPNFEHGGRKQVCGKTIGIHEYSLSYIGPSRNARETARCARRRGLRAYAKLQTGTTYELATVPYLPVPNIIHDKLARMHRLGFSGAMAQWILGGYPSLMHKAVGEASFAPLPDKRRFIRRLAAIEWGERRAEAVAKAWTKFSEAFLDYPSSVPAFYFGPIDRAPAYQLHLEKEPRRARPYNFGLTATRHVSPWDDDVQGWCKELCAGELVECYRRLGRRWRDGLKLLARAFAGATPRLESRDPLMGQYVVAAAATIHFLSAANIIEFYAARDRLLAADVPLRKCLLFRMRQIVAGEIQLAREMKPYPRVEPALGYFGEFMAFAYTIPMIEDKIRHARRTLRTLDHWLRRGVDERVLRTALPAPRLPKYKDRMRQLLAHAWLSDQSGPRPKPTWREWLQYGD